MSSPIGQGGRALVLRLVLAEVLAKRGEGPLAPRFTSLARTTARFGAQRPRAARVPPAAESAGEPADKERA